MNMVLSHPYHVIMPREVVCCVAHDQPFVAVCACVLVCVCVCI